MVHEKISPHDIYCRDARYNAHKSTSVLHHINNMDKNIMQQEMHKNKLTKFNIRLSQKLSTTWVQKGDA